MKYKFSASLMCMNILQLEKQINFLNSRVDFYHVDIMDGHFVKNLTLSPMFIKQIRGITCVPIDAHLMVERPDDFILDLVNSGVDCLTLHAETINKEAFRLINKIRDLNCKIGVALNPATPIEQIKYYISHLDKITVMTVDPGYAGQSFIPEVLDKIRSLKELKEMNSFKYSIEVDGACNKDTFKIMAEAGAEIFTLGSTGLFKLDDNLESAWEKMIANFN